MHRHIALLSWQLRSKRRGQCRATIISRLDNHVFEIELLCRYTVIYTYYIKCHVNWDYDLIIQTCRQPKYYATFKAIDAVTIENIGTMRYTCNSFQYSDTPTYHLVNNKWQIE